LGSWGKGKGKKEGVLKKGVNSKSINFPKSLEIYSLYSNYFKIRRDFSPPTES
jgi:hypothetical protein